MSPEQEITHNPSGQPDIPGSQTAGSVRCGVFFPQACIQAKYRLLGQFLGEGRIQSMQAFNDNDAIPAIDGLRAVGLLQFKVKDRCLADAFLMQFLQAAVQHRKIQRLQTFVIIAAVVIFGIPPRAGIKIVQTEHHAPAPLGLDDVRQFVG